MQSAFVAAASDINVFAVMASPGMEEVAAVNIFHLLLHQWRTSAFIYEFPFWLDFSQHSESIQLLRCSLALTHCLGYWFIIINRLFSSMRSILLLCEQTTHFCNTAQVLLNLYYKLLKCEQGSAVAASLLAATVPCQNVGCNKHATCNCYVMEGRCECNRGYTGDGTIYRPIEKSLSTSHYDHALSPFMYRLNFKVVSFQIIKGLRWDFPPFVIHVSKKQCGGKQDFSWLSE